MIIYYKTYYNLINKYYIQYLSRIKYLVIISFILLIIECLNK